MRLEGGLTGKSYWELQIKWEDGHCSVSVLCFVTWLECLLATSEDQLGTHDILWLQPVDLATKCADGRFFCRIQGKGDAVLFGQLGYKCGSYQLSFLGLAGFLVGRWSLPVSLHADTRGQPEENRSKNGALPGTPVKGADSDDLTAF